MKLIKVPFSKGGLGKSDGSEIAPDIITKRIKEFYLTEEGHLPVFEVDEVSIDQNNIEITHKNIFEKVKELKENCILIGGDHSITFPAVKAFSELYNNTGLIIFDAHPDAEYNVGISHEDYLRALVDYKIVKKENIILVGLRNRTKDELEFLQKNKIRCFDMRKITMEGISDIADTITESARNFNALYLSVDIDVVDQAFAPGTGYAEPGGLTSRELVYFIHRIKKLKNIKIIDLVEVNPKIENYLTTKLAAKIVVELY